MRYNDVCNIVFSERDVVMSANAGNKASNDYYLFELSSVT